MSGSSSASSTTQRLRPIAGSPIHDERLNPKQVLPTPSAFTKKFVQWRNDICTWSKVPTFTSITSNYSLIAKLYIVCCWILLLLFYLLVYFYLFIECTKAMDSEWYYMCICYCIASDVQHFAMHCSGFFLKWQILEREWCKILQAYR